MLIVDIMFLTVCLYHLSLVLTHNKSSSSKCWLIVKCSFSYNELGICGKLSIFMFATFCHPVFTAICQSLCLLVGHLRKLHVDYHVIWGLGRL